MSDIKLNQWTWGVVPELHPEAIVRLGGNRQSPLRHSDPARIANVDDRMERWYTVLSLGPPEMPEEELRLPDGWEVGFDEQKISCWMLSVERKMSYSNVRARLQVFEPTRAECVREINKLLGGER